MSGIAMIEDHVKNPVLHTFDYAAIMLSCMGISPFEIRQVMDPS
jgi:hypothetical protein